MENLLIDVDGTICTDLKNEESHLYPDAKPFKGAAERLWKKVEEGAKVYYFTAREEKDREVTMQWLEKHGFPIHGLIMGKPRHGNIKIIDNLKMTTIHFVGEEWADDFVF